MGKNSYKVFVRKKYMKRINQRSGLILTARMGSVESCCREQKEDVLLVSKMDLSHCGCVEVPNVVFNAERCIETLILASNQISSLPPQLFHCQELKHLNLYDNCLTSIPPAIGSLMHLVSLKLDKNNLTDLPENLKCCRKLKRLSLSNNQWKQVPNIVTQLISLEEMYMNDSELSFLPASVGRLTKLKILELRNNNLCNLPLSMSRLSSLTRLDIGGNEFTEFPACIHSLKSISELLIDNNDIEEITDIKNLVNLEHFDASYNHISTVSETIGYCTNLNMLNLSFNYLEQLPDSIGNVEKLETLHLEMNELTEVPKTIGKLKNLEDLNICNNRLCNIPISIGLLRKLKNLNLSRNTIEEFPPEIGSCTKLTIINAGYNRLQVLPSEIGYLNNLKVLDLVGNFLMYLPITIINLRSIKAIWLSANQNVPLIPFTEDINIASGERFLTNIALPQLGEIPCHNNQTKTENKLLVSEKSASWSKKIRFAEDDNLLPGKLHRTPTPFPKELRAPNRKQHLRNEGLKGNDNYVNLIDGKAYEELQPPTNPIMRNGSGLMNFTETCITRIREANIIRSNKDSNNEIGIQEHPEGDHIRNPENEYLRETSVDYGPVSDMNFVNQDSFKNDLQEEETRYIYLNNIQRNKDVEMPPQFSADGNGENEMQLCDREDEKRACDEMEECGRPCERSQSYENRPSEKIFYSNVFNNAHDNGNLRENSPVGYSQDYRNESRNITDLCQEDTTGKGINSIYNNDVSNKQLRDGINESTSQNRPNYLNLQCSNYSHRKLSQSDSYSTNNIQSNVIQPQTFIKNENEKLSKQEMILLTEKMRSKNISPPCYEIAKMYSTKAALFEQNRLENCN